MLNYFKTSISRKIVGTFSLFLILVTVIIISYYLDAQEKQIRKSLDRYIIAVGEILAFTSGNALGDFNMGALDEVFKWAKQDKSIKYLAIMEKNGNTLASYNPGKLKKNYKRLLTNGSIFEDRENNLLLTSIDINHQEASLGTILLGYSLEETKMEIEHSRRVSLLIIVPFCLIGIGSIIFISAAVTRPIKELSDAAGKISAEMDDLSVKVKTGNLTGESARGLENAKVQIPGNSFKLVNDQSGDEVVKLAKTFNIMTNNIHRTTRELNEKNDELSNTLVQLKEIQLKLIEKEKLASLAGLTAGIAHEIRNPLNFVNNFSEVNVELVEELREVLEPEKEKFGDDIFDDIEDILSTLEKNSRKINEHGKMADSIIGRMLQHSSGKKGEVRPTKLNDFIREYVTLAYQGVRAKDTQVNINIETDYDDTIGEINIIPQDLSRVILNIVNNACYAAFEKKKEIGEKFQPFVYIRSDDLGDSVEIKIKDNGNGIPPESIKKIFNPFFTTKPTGEGTGLGLSISYDIIVQDHHGQLSVKSEPGFHTEFIITIPKNLKTGAII